MPALPAVPDTVEGQGLRKATALMAVGTTLSRATGLLRLFALGYAIGDVQAGGLLQPRQHDAQHRPGHRPGRDPVGHVRPGVRAPPHHPRRRRGVGRGLRGGERHPDRHRRRFGRLPGRGPVHRRRHHGAEPQCRRRPDPAAGQGPAVPVRAPAHLLRLHQRGHRPAQRATPLRGADVHPHRQQRGARRRAARLRHRGPARHPAGRRRAPGADPAPRPRHHSRRGDPGRADDPEPPTGRPAAALDAGLPSRVGAHHHPPVGVDLRAGDDQPGRAGGGPRPVPESGFRRRFPLTPTPTCSSSCPTASWPCRS